MYIGNVIRHWILESLQNWQEYLGRHRADPYSEQLGKILLFHAAFSNFFDKNLQLKTQQVYDQFQNRLHAEDDGQRLLFDYAPIIILHKVFKDYSQDADEPFHKLLQLGSSKNPGARLLCYRMLLFYLDQNIDYKNEALGISLKTSLVGQAYDHIDAHHYDNIYLFSLLHFLRMSSEEKTELFQDLLERAREKEARVDAGHLEKILQRDPNLVNPFYSYLMDCQQEAMRKWISFEFNPDKLQVGVQLDLFNAPVKPVFLYHFEDPRLQYHLKWNPPG